MILFHGTSTKHKDAILRDGLLPRESTGVSNWAEIHNGSVESKSHLVYLTLAYPVFFAVQAAGDNDDLLILKVEVDEKDLYPDEDFLAQVLQAQENLDLPLEQINKMVEPLDNQHLLPECLKWNGLAATSHVPPEKIIDHRVIKSGNIGVIMFIGGDSIPIPANFYILGTRYQQAIEALFDKGESEAVKVMLNSNFNLIQQLQRKENESTR